jgi:four helix bundle protein
MVIKLVKNKDLLDRTEKFSLDVIKEVRKISKNQVNMIIIGHCIRSVTSIGANYREACEAESSRDFVHKLRLCKKEARESNYWLILLLKTNTNNKKQLMVLAEEAIQLVKIFSSIVSKFNK